MRNLTYKSIQYIFEKYPEYQKIENFVETGTYKGGTIFPMSQHFTNLYTIEICENAYKYCIKRAKKRGIKNINFYLGDSSEVISEIISELQKPSIYFLDGHVTQNSSGFTEKAKKDVPLLEELQCINQLDSQASMIIIDDIRLLGKTKSKKTAGADWSEISLSKILNSFDEGRIFDHFYDNLYDPEKLTNDRYYILLRKK